MPGAPSPSAAPVAAPFAARLVGDTVSLRPLTRADLPALVEQCRDPGTVRWTTVPEGYGPADAEAFLARVEVERTTTGRTTWVVEGDGAFAGLVSLRRLAGAGDAGSGVVEVSFAAHPATRGHGYLTEAVRLVSRHALVDDGAAAVLWHALVGNVASRRVAWKAGFRIAADPVWRRGHPGHGPGPERVWTGRLLPGEPLEPATRWFTPAVLEGDGVRLRPFRAEDAAALPEVADAATRAYAAGLPTPAAFPEWLLGRQTQMALGRAVFWAVADAATDRLLGGLDVQRLDIPIFAGTGVLGYWLLPAARGRGVLGRALELLVPHAFRPVAEGGLGLHQLGAGCAVDNRASARVLRRAGFAPVGTERQTLQVDGAPSDALLFELLAGDDRDAQRVEPGRLPVLETEHLRLRPWSEEDVPRPDQAPDADALRFMPPGAQPDAERFPAWLRRRRLGEDTGENLDWAVTDRVTGEVLGDVCLIRLGPARGRFQGELGYWLHPAARGRGVLREAVPVVVDHAFAPVAEGGLGLERLHAATDLDNAASQAILLASGFRRWGTDRHAFRNGAGEITDGASFELLATDDRRDRRPPRVDPPTLEDAAVRLRPWRDDDAERLVEACTDERSRRWLADLPHPYTRDDALAYVRHCAVQATLGRALLLAVADPSGDECLGSIGVMGLGGPDPTAGEVGYWAHPDARGRGVTTAAVRLLVAHAFRPPEQGGLGLRRLVLRAAAGNTASQRVAEANGFTRTGVERAAERLGDGTWDDLVGYDRLVDDPDG